MFLRKKFVVLMLFCLGGLPGAVLLAQDNPTITPAPIIPTPVIDVNNNTGTGETGSGQPILIVTTAPLPTDIPVESTQEVGAETTAEPTPAATATPPPAPQSQDGCPTLVDVAYSTLIQQCGGLEADQLCIGLGTVNAAPRVNPDTFSFNAIGERTRTSGLNFLQLNTFGGADLAWTVVAGSWILTASDNFPALATVVVLGEVVITDRGANASAGFPTGTISAANGLVIRNRPDSAGGAILGASSGEELTVTGRTVDRQWYRVELPNFGGVGWVFAQFMTLDENVVEGLQFVNEQSPEPDVTRPKYTSMQSIGFESAAFDSLDTCPEIPNSGMVIQTPANSANALQFQINGVEFSLNGTAYVEAARSGEMRLSLIDGSASAINGEDITAIPVGAAAVTTLDAELNATGTIRIEPFDQVNLSRLPVTILPNPVTIGAPYVPPSATTPPQDVAVAATPTATGVRAVGPSGDLNLYATITPTPAPIQPGIVAPTSIADQPPGVVIVGPSGNVAVVTPETHSSSTQTTVVSPAGTPSTPDLPTPVPVVEPASLQSSAVVGNLCSINPPASISKSADNTDSPATQIGGTWTTSSGLTILLRGTNFNLTTPDPSYGDYIRIVATDGSILAQSGDNTALAYTFPASGNFIVEFAANSGDFIVMTAECTG